MIDRVAVATTAGVRHERAGEPCGDVVRVRHAPRAPFFWVVCDGAGAAASGLLGAEIVADTVLEALVAAAPPELRALDGPTWRALARSLVEDARVKLVARAEADDRSLVDLACTALFGVVDDAGGRFAQLGDGAVVVDAGGACLTVTAAPEAEHPNETVFVTDEPASIEASLSTAVVTDPIDTLLVTTDGLERLVLSFPRREPVPALVRALASDLRRCETVGLAEARLLELLRSERVRARTDDDCALLVAVGALDVTGSTAERAGSPPPSAQDGEGADGDG